MTNLKAQLDQQCRVQHCWSCPKGLKHWDRNQANASVHCPGTNSIRPCAPALSDTLVLASVKKEHIKCIASVTGSLNLETQECYCCCCAEVSALACWQDLSRGSGKLKNNEPQRWQTQRPWQVCPHRRQPQDIRSRAPVWSNLRRRTYRSGRSFGNPSRHIEVNSCRAKWSWEATKHRNLAQCNRGRTFVVTAERQWSRNSSRSLPWWTQWLALLDTMSHRNRTAREVRGTLYRCWVLILLMMAQANRWTAIAHHFLQEKSGTRQPAARLAKNSSSRLQTPSFEDIYRLINRIPPTKFLLRSWPYVATSEFLVSILTASFAACLYVHLQQLLQLIQRRKLESQSVNPLETKKETIIEMRRQLLQHRDGIILHEPAKFLTCSRENNSVWHWRISTWLMLQTQKIHTNECNTKNALALCSSLMAVKMQWKSRMYTVPGQYLRWSVSVTSESDMIKWLLIHWKLFAFVSCLQLAVAWNTFSSLKSCRANPRNMGSPSRRSAAGVLCCNREGGPAACAGCGSPRNYKHRGNPQPIFQPMTGHKT